MPFLPRKFTTALNDHVNTVCMFIKRKPLGKWLVWSPSILYGCWCIVRTPSWARWVCIGSMGPSCWNQPDLWPWWWAKFSESDLSILPGNSITVPIRPLLGRRRVMASLTRPTLSHGDRVSETPGYKCRRSFTFTRTCWLVLIGTQSFVLRQRSREALPAGMCILQGYQMIWAIRSIFTPFFVN